MKGGNNMYLSKLLERSYQIRNIEDDQENKFLIIDNFLAIRSFIAPQSIEAYNQMGEIEKRLRKEKRKMEKKGK